MGNLYHGYVSHNQRVMDYTKSISEWICGHPPPNATFKRSMAKSSCCRYRSPCAKSCWASVNSVPVAMEHHHDHRIWYTTSVRFFAWLVVSEPSSWSLGHFISCPVCSSLPTKQGHENQSFLAFSNQTLILQVEDPTVQRSSTEFNGLQSAVPVRLGRPAAAAVAPGVSSAPPFPAGPRRPLPCAKLGLGASHRWKTLLTFFWKIHVLYCYVLLCHVNLLGIVDTWIIVDNHHFLSGVVVITWPCMSWDTTIFIRFHKFKYAIIQPLQHCVALILLPPEHVIIRKSFFLGNFRVWIQRVNDTTGIHRVQSTLPIHLRFLRRIASNLNSLWNCTEWRVPHGMPNWPMHAGICSLLGMLCTSAWRIKQIWDSVQDFSEGQAPLLQVHWVVVFVQFSFQISKSHFISWTGGRILCTPVAPVLVGEVLLLKPHGHWEWTAMWRISLSHHLDSSGTQYGNGQRPNHQFCRAPYLHRNPAPLPPWLKQTSSPAAIIETPTTWRFHDVRSTISFLPSGKHWDSEDWLEYSRTIETKDSPRAPRVTRFCWKNCLSILPVSNRQESCGSACFLRSLAGSSSGDGSNNGSKTVPPGDGFAAAETNAPRHCHSQGLSQFSHEGVRRCAVQDLTKLVLWTATVTSCHIMSHVATNLRPKCQCQKRDRTKSGCWSRNLPSLIWILKLPSEVSAWNERVLDHHKDHIFLILRLVKTWQTHRQGIFDFLKHLPSMITCKKMLISPVSAQVKWWRPQRESSESWPKINTKWWGGFWSNHAQDLHSGTS